MKVVPKLTPEQAKLERDLFREFEDLLIEKGFVFLSIPSALPMEVMQAQFRDTFMPDTMKAEEGLFLSGSAEQGILHYFKDQEVAAPSRYYAFNQCWRLEDSYEGFLRCKEFRKLEQFSFVEPENWEEEFDFLIDNAMTFLLQKGLTARVVDCTNEYGYHIAKKDIEVLTKQYGWIETHSCTYFGDGQTSRLNIGGGMHTISNTGLASPRILIPFLERT